MKIEVNLEVRKLHSQERHVITGSLKIPDEEIEKILMAKNVIPEDIIPFPRGTGYFEPRDERTTDDIKTDKFVF